jgi:hypothetical protein
MTTISFARHQFPPAIICHAGASPPSAPPPAGNVAEAIASKAESLLRRSS